MPQTPESVDCGYEILFVEDGEPERIEATDPQDLAEALLHVRMHHPDAEWELFALAMRPLTESETKAVDEAYAMAPMPS